MKKKLFSVLAVVAIAAVAGYNVYHNSNEVKLSDLAISNVEALAQGEYSQKIWKRYIREDGGYNCIRGGSESC